MQQILVFRSVDLRHYWFLQRRIVWLCSPQIRNPYTRADASSPAAALIVLEHAAPPQLITVLARCGAVAGPLMWSGRGFQAPETRSRRFSDLASLHFQISTLETGLLATNSTGRACFADLSVSQLSETCRGILVFLFSSQNSPGKQNQDPGQSGTLNHPDTVLHYRLISKTPPLSLTSLRRWW